MRLVRQIRYVHVDEAQMLSLEEEDEGLHTDDLPAGPMIEETHSYKLSPLGPALQSSGLQRDLRELFCMRFAAELIDPPFDMIAEACSPTTSAVPYQAAGHRGDLFKTFQTIETACTKSSS